MNIGTFEFTDETKPAVPEKQSLPDDYTCYAFSFTKTEITVVDAQISAEHLRQMEKLFQRYPNASAIFAEECDWEGNPDAFQSLLKDSSEENARAVLKRISKRRLLDPNEPLYKFYEKHAVDTNQIPVIQLPTLTLPGLGVRLTDTANDCFSGLASTEEFFVRGDSVVKKMHKNGRDELREISADEFRSLMEQYFDLRQVKKKGQGEEATFVSVFAICSAENAKAILVSSGRDILPKIQRVVSCPVIDSTGSICRAGYHKHISGGVYVASGDAREGIEPEAVNSIKGLFADFAFATEADKTRAIASLITPALALGGHITGNIPVDVAEADQSQSGKTYRQMVTCAVYNETPIVIRLKKGGVGSIDESFDSALLTGRPFIQFDNFRGRLDSPALESALTSNGGEVSVRVPHKGMSQVSIQGVSIYISSNGVDLTRDQANRSSIIRIKKRKEHNYKTFPEGDLLDHVRAKQGYYLGCVFAVVKQWIRQGRQQTIEIRHDFREWAKVTDWIMRNVFECSDLMEGHQSLQSRVSTPILVAMRDLALCLESQDRLDEAFKAGELLTFAEDHGIMVPVGDGSEEKRNQALGRKLGQVFKEASVIPIDHLLMERVIVKEQREGHAGKIDYKYYKFRRP